MKLNPLEPPKMILNLVWSIFVYTLTEVEMFLLAVVSVLVGLQFGILMGATVYVGTYFTMRMIGGYVKMIASNLEFIARGTGRNNV